MRLAIKLVFSLLLFISISLAQTKYTWTGGSGSWQTASNWNPNGVPGAADTAVVNGGTVTSDLSVTIASIFQNAGIINGTGNFIVTSKFTLLTGTHGGTGTTTISASATGSFASTSGKTISRTFVNDGLLDITGTGSVSFSTGAQVINNGTMDFKVLVSFGNTNGTLVNNGTLLRSSSTGAAAIGAPFTNNGTINVQSGELVSVAGMTGSGSFNIADATKFRLTGGTSTIGGNSISGIGTFELAGGILNFSGNAVTVSTGTTFLQSSGTIGGDGNLVINGYFNLATGTHGGTGTTTISASATGSFASTSGKTISRTFVNDGLLDITGTGSVSFSTGAQVINNGTMDFKVLVSFGNTNGTLVNNGTLLRSSSTGAAAIGAPFTNNGTINVQSGELVSVAGMTGSGSFNIADATKFRLTGGTSTIGGNSISGIGTFELAGGILNFSGNAVTVSTGTTFLQSSGTIGGDGNLVINGYFNLATGTHGGTGTTTISASATGSFASTSGKTISRTFVNDGLLDITGTGSVSFSTGAQVINNGTMDFKVLVSFGNTNGTLVNNGTLLRSSSTGAAAIGAPFTNNGTINVQSGELVSVAGMTGSGSFNIADATKFRLTGGTSTIGGNSISGIGTFELAGGILNFSGNAVTVSTGTTFLQSSGTIGGDGNLVINGYFNLATGTHGGTGTTTISASATGSFASTSGKTISRTFVNDGLLDITGTGSVSFSTGAQVINNGTMDFKVLVSFGNTNGTLVNNGTLLRSSSTGAATIAAPFTNNGTTKILTGALSFASSLNNNISGEISGIGTLISPTGGFINDGSVSPGTSPGVLSVSGNYPQSSSGVLNIEIGGYASGSERDSLFVSGQANLNGSLNVQFINNFIPTVGDSFMVMGYGSRVGQFSQVNFSNNVSGQIQYLSNGAQVLITSGGINQPPVAVDDAAQTNEDVAVIINVLANDSDPDNDSLSINGFTQPIHGSAVQSGDSSISYTPALNYFGLDSLTYTIKDPNGATASAKVRITILPVNDPPTAPVLLLPVSGDTLNSNQTINFVWHASSDPENEPLFYALRIWGNSLDTTIAGVSDTTLAFNNPNAFQQNNSYQWQVTASDGNLSTPSAIRSFYTASTAMAGVYTIGIGGDFATITSAVEALETFGISGSVTFNILTGSYNEQIVLGSVSGSSATNKIMFQSQSGNPEDVMFRYTGASTGNNYVLRFNGSSYIIFRNLTFRTSTPDAGRLIDFSGINKGITLEGNHFSGAGTSSSDTKFSLIYSKDAEIDSLEIRNNFLYDGSYGLLLSDSVSNVRLFNNECKRQSFTSFRLQQVAGLEIISNRIDNRPALNGNNSYGIRIDTCWQTLKITGNRILLAGLNNSSGAKGGIFLRGFIGSTERGLIANNFIRMWVQSGVVAGASGIMVTPGGVQFDGCDLYNNTIWITGGPTQVCYPLFVSTSTASSEMRIKNNILINETDGLAMFSYNAQSTSQSDYNDLFSNGSSLIFWNNSYYSNLASYQTATGQDLNSLNILPRFLSPEEVYLNDIFLNNAGTPLAEVTTDIDGELRDPNTPDIGADEFQLQGGISGIFTIGVGGDFQTINAAVNMLNDTLITGPVTFNILPGVYDEQVVLSSVVGASSEDPIIFKSQSGNPEDVIWGYSTQSVGSNYVALLNNTSNIIIRDLKLKAMNRQAGCLIEMQGIGRQIKFDNNIFLGIDTNATDIKYAIIYSNSYQLDSIEIRNNFLYDGSYGLLLSDSVSNVRLFNNECKRQSFTSFRLQQVAGLEIISNRIDNRPALNGNNSYGIRIDTCWQTLKITGNRILLAGLNNSSGAKGGIFLRGFIGSTERGLIANNFIRMWVQSGVVAGASGIMVTPGGVQFDGCDLYNNTIWITGGPTQVCYPLFVSTSTASSEMRIKNNILINETDGLAMFSYNAQSTSQSDYNDLFSNGSSLIFWNNSYYSNLALYQTTTGQDLHSISADPLFVSSDDLHIKSGSPVDGKGTPLAEVPRDIDNQLRSLTVPDIGADEYTAQRIIIKRKNKLNKTILPLTITRDSLFIDPRLDPMISGYVLSDVNVFIDTLVHTNLADLEIYLTHNGVTDTLANFLPDSASGFIGTILDDSGLLTLSEGVSPFTGSYRPYSPLSVFNGIDPEGEWVLEIYDRSTGNFGILDAWGIELVFEIATNVEDEEEKIILPENYELLQNYPNPFNPATTIKYSIPDAGLVSLSVYNILGEQVKILINQEMPVGNHSVQFNASNLASGIYLYRIQAGSYVETKKMILIK